MKTKHFFKKKVKIFQSEHGWALKSKQGLTPQHEIYVVRRVGVLVGVLSLRDSISTNLCLECEFFFCNEKSKEARNFVLSNTIRTSLQIAETKKFVLVIFRCCDIFPEVVKTFENLDFELIMIHRVLILFSCIHMLTFAKAIINPSDTRSSVSIHIPGNVPPSSLNDDTGEPATGTAQEDRT